MVDVKYRRGAWRALIDLLHAQKFWIDKIADDFGITGLMAKALHELPASGSMTMKELAAELWCDASNVTGIIDRLESRGFVERRPSEADRRVKCVVLTTAGKRLRRKIDDRFNESPPAIAALSDADQQTLREILERALENATNQRAAEAG
jgi:DNA-binding MarR family transcriptional regulator